jgi:hypothetical protein
MTLAAGGSRRPVSLKWRAVATAPSAAKTTFVEYLARARTRCNIQERIPLRPGFCHSRRNRARTELPMRMAFMLKTCVGYRVLSSDVKAIAKAMNQAM